MTYVWEKGTWNLILKQMKPFRQGGLELAELRSPSSLFGACVVPVTWLMGLFKGSEELLHRIQDNNGIAAGGVPAPRVGPFAGDTISVVTDIPAEQVAFNHPLKNSSARERHVATHADPRGDVAIDMDLGVRSSAEGVV